MLVVIRFGVSVGSMMLMKMCYGDVLSECVVFLSDVLSFDVVVIMVMIMCGIEKYR